MARMVLQDGEDLIPVLLIEGRCLKAIRVEDDLMATTGAGFLFRCL
jgi:hypothetical protein